MISVTSTGIYIPTHELKNRLGKKYETFKDKLKLTHKPIVGNVITYNVAPISKINGIFNTRIPRSVLPSLSKLFSVDVKLPAINNINVLFTGELTESQQVVVDYIMNEKFNPENIRSGCASMYLDMKAGYGKSYVLAGIIARLKLKSLIVTANTSLARQMYDDLTSCLGCNIGMYNGSTIKSDGTIKGRTLTNFDVTIVIINTAIAIPNDIMDQYSFIAIDEAQDFCTGTFGKIFERIPNVALSMSATPDEKPSCFIGIKCAGPVIAADTIEGFSYNDIKFDIDVEAIHYHGDPNYTHHILSSIGKMDAREMHRQFLEDEFRTKMIADKILEIYNEVLEVPIMDDDIVVCDDDTGEPIMEKVNHCIYVFAEELDHLRKIHKYLSDIAYAPELDDQIGEQINADIGMFTGGISRETNDHIRKNSRILLTTYGYSAKGTSVAKMTAEVFLTSRKSKMKQIVARILRRSGDKRIKRRIIDIIDESTGIKRQYNERLLAYKFYGANIIDTHVYHE